MGEDTATRRPELLGSARKLHLVQDQRQRAVESQQATRDPAIAEYSEGVQETLGWAVGELFEAPGSRAVTQPTTDAMFMEIRALRGFAADPDAIGHFYAAGAVASLDWLTARTEDLPIAWARPPKSA